MRAIGVLVVGALLLIPAGAYGEITASYGWEDFGTILGSYGNLVDPTNVAGAQPRLEGNVAVDDVPGPHSGNRYLHVAEDPHYSTPQAYLAFVEGLEEGDTIDADFWGYDTTEGSAPSWRIWGHWALNGDVDSYEGSASGNTAYTAGTGWDNIGHQWTVPAGKEALVIEGRLYSSPSTSDPNHTDYFADDISVTVTPAGETTPTITFAPEPATLALLGLGGLALLRRRR